MSFPQNAMASGIFGCVLQIGKVVYEPAMEHGDYLVHYKSHVDNFKNEVESLKNIRGDVMRLVDDACRRKEELKADVEEWLKSVEEVKEDAGRLVSGAEGSAGCLSGWLPNCYVRYNLGKEAKQKTNYVKELQSIGRSFRSVSFSLPLPSTDSMLAGGDYVAFASREAAVEEIMQALSNEAIGTIGVYGMGGVGKTTLMKEMGKLVKRKGLFNDVVMVEVSLEPKPSKIQAEIAGQLGLKLNKDSEAVRKGQLLERLQGTKTLVILDNVWEQLDLVEIGIPCGPNGQGCKIMLTTRDKYVCNMHGSQTIMIEVRFLTEMESLDLFKVMICSDVDSSILEEYGKDIVKECGGIPLLLAAVGTALRPKDKKVWADALTRLRRGSMIGEIFPGLQLSYEFLETNEIKSCFLFCCLFPEGSDIDIETLVRYGFGEEFLDEVETLKEARERVHSLIDKLKARCLLLDGYQEGYVKMHDCVRDVTRSIASKDENGFLVRAGVEMKDWPRKEKLNKCKRISLIRSTISMLPAEPDCPNLLTLLFQENYSLKKFPDSFFRGMKSLVVLDLSYTGISSLPCVTTLRVLLLNKCFDLTDLSLLGEMEKLEILSLIGTNIRELPEEVGRLSNLKLLDLSYTRYLERVPPNVVRRLQCLEELYMRGSFSAWEVKGTGDGNNASLVEVVSLDRLTMLDISVKNAECFSQETSFSCTNLSRFYVTGCRDYQMRGDRFSMAVEGKYRRISLEISKPVSSFVKCLIERSEELELVRSKHSDVERWEKMFKYGLAPVPKDLRFLKFCDWANPFLPSCLLQSAKIELLWIVDCQKMEKMVQDEDGDAASPVKPLWASAFENLQFLEVKGCIALKNLLSWKLARALEQLKKLIVDGCIEMEVIITNGGAADTSVLPHLQEIYLMNMPNLKSFCEGEALLELRSLLTIRVIRCSSVKRHLLGPSSALSLQYMNGESILPSNLPLKMRLEPRMEIIGCQTLEKIVPDEYENLPSLMKAVRPSLFENLQFLNMQHCHGFKNLLSWRLARALEQLKKLKVQGCNEMEVIIGYGGEVDSSTFPRLHSIHLEDMPKLRCFCEGEVLLKLRSLLAIRVIRCSSVKRHLLGPSSALSLQFMTGESILPSNLPLKMGIGPRMEIIGCQTMEKIVPDEYENLSSPTKVVRPSLFENLQFLNMQHCHGFKNLLSWRLARALD
ncbi:disease resistance protein At4g27190-like [Magnolia sinica]|uniref:disease resistance protein At4g27190-like n=1 Tax=Magnolia sinica TaxID=86752 RepID=UPI00265B6C23|nr:disease resistance protein At4g27190-like [Magnolia sinica]